MAKSAFDDRLPVVNAFGCRRLRKKTEADAMAVVPLRMSRRSERQRME